MVAARDMLVAVEKQREYSRFSHLYITMTYETKIKNWKELVEQAAQTTKSATEAAAALGVKYDTYKKYAIKYGCFTKNPSGKGLQKKGISIPLQDIFDGKHPQYQSNKLRLRLIEENILPRCCNSCKLLEWLTFPIPLELNHINGISTDHCISNLELLCPNCHAMTSTYRGKNKGRMVK